MFKRRVFVFQLFFFLGEGMVIIIIIIIIKCVRIFFYVVVSLRTVVVFVTSFLRSVSCIYVCGKVNVCL